MMTDVDASAASRGGIEARLRSAGLPALPRMAWLEVDLGKPMTFSRVAISEEYDRVQRFELQYKDGETWKTFVQGTRIGDKYTQTFDPVTAQHVRLNILDATDGPTIWEFHLLSPKQ
jgi:alpha-L-fucosidase